MASSSGNTLCCSIRPASGRQIGPGDARAANPAAAPPPSAPAVPEIPAAPAAATAIVETKTQATAQRIDPPGDQPGPSDKAASRKTTHIKVGAKATLRGIAWRAGERSEADLQKMMIAIFRANPSAFDGNINRLHRGAILTIPSRAQAATIPSAEAEREVHAQMAAWHAAARTAPREAMKAHPAVAAADSTPSASTTLSASSTSPTSDHSAPAGEVLAHRVQSLEQELSDMKGLLESEQNQLDGLARQAAGTDKPAPAALPPPARAPRTIAAPGTGDARPTADAPPAQRKTGDYSLPAIIAGLGLLGAALGGLYAKFRRRTPVPRHDGDLPAADAVVADASVGDASVADASVGDASVADASVAGAAVAVAAEVDTAGVAAAEATDAVTAEHAVHSRESMQNRDGALDQDFADAEALMRAIAEAHADDATHPMLPILPAAAVAAPAATAGRSEAAPEPTVNMRADTVNMRMEPTRLDYNLLDLDLTAQHVQMPSVLNEHAVVKERRTNLADVLRLAIEREPDRHDLRMKLLELYYAAAATNRKAFLEVVQKFARDRDYLQAEQWDKIAFMGRQIAAENPLFAEPSAADDDLADCA